MSYTFPVSPASAHNAPSYRACIQLLSSLSGYQYTRRAWKKEAFDLFMDHTFFQMDSSCVSHWRAIIDHLMTHDKTTFRDLMTRVAVAQSSSLSLFTNRDAELEQRAMLLKRLAFTIYSSEVDQYQKYLPDIQERLVESLRLPQVPILHAQVFLFFRVLLLRMSPQHLTSLWPTMITELVRSSRWLQASFFLFCSLNCILDVFLSFSPPHIYQLTHTHSYTLHLSPCRFRCFF